MIDQLKQYPKTFQKFVEWMKNQKKYLDDKNRFYWRYECGKASTLYELVYHSIYLTNRELLSLLVEFCDSEGYYTSIRYFPLSNTFDSVVNDLHIIEKLEIYHTLRVNSRTEATENAIKKCFELMESE